MKKLYIVLLVLFMQSYTFASYYTPDINKDCILESYNKINEFINKCGECFFMRTLFSRLNKEE